MNAFPDEPDGFVRWLDRRGMGFDADAFVPRLIYGEYLRDLLAFEMSRQPGRLTLVQGDAVAIDMGAGVRVSLADGRVVAADLAVLAVGNLPPHHPRGFGAHLPSDLYSADPWSASATSGLERGDTVLLLGTGLTMVDVALRLRDEGFEGAIVALSRRGLLPHRHGPQSDFSPIEERPTGGAPSLTRAVRRRAAAVGWRNAIDELRPFTQPLWRGADDATRSRFLRHLRPWWDIHRHRLAPAIAERIEALQEAGSLSVVAGSTRQAVPSGDRLAIIYHPRGGGDFRELVVRRAINCTGPQGDLAAATDPLLCRLARNGTIRADALAIGIDVDEQSRIIGANGHANPSLYAIGPMTRGAFWEIVAVPDIRRQVWALARRLSNAHWVGGEGL